MGALLAASTLLQRMLYGARPARRIGPLSQDHQRRCDREPMRAELRSALSDKARDGKLRVVEALKFDEYRTMGVVELLADMNLLDAKVLFVIDEKNEKFVKSAANVPVVNVRHPGNASVYEVVEADELVMTAAAAKALELRLAK